MLQLNNSKNFHSFGITTVMLAVFVSLAFAQSQREIQKLSLNQPVESKIKGGETHSFEFEVKAGFYARAEVEQKNIDVVVSLFAPDGKLVVEMDGRDGRLWREAVSCIAEKGGLYRVEIKAYGAADQSGSYTVKLAESRQSAPDDRKRLQAEARLSNGRRFFEQFKRQEAVNEYEGAAGLWRELGEAEWEAITLLNLGWTYSYLSKNEQAIDTHTQAKGLLK